MLYSSSDTLSTKLYGTLYRTGDMNKHQFIIRYHLYCSNSELVQLTVPHTISPIRRQRPQGFPYTISPIPAVVFYHIEILVLTKTSIQF